MVQLGDPATRLRLPRPLKTSIEKTDAGWSWKAETVPEATVEGKIQVGEMEIYGKGISPVAVRRRIGMVFQKPNPFPTMSIYDNVAAGLKLNGFRKRRELDEIVERSLQQAALWEEVKDELKKKSGISLSGGHWRCSRRSC